MTSKDSDTDEARDNPSPRFYRFILLGLATLLLVNPFVLFLLNRSVPVSLGISACVITAILVIYSRPRLKVLTAYLFNLIFLVSLLLHGEVLILHIFPHVVYQSLYEERDGYFFNKPSLDETAITEEFSTSFRTNIQGFRIPQFQGFEREIDSTDWLFLGDSFTQGAQVEFESLFSTKINRRFPDKVVLNAGMSGAGIAQEYNYFVNEGHRYKPSLVILQVCSFNDFMNVAPQETSLTGRLMNDWAIMRLLLSNLHYQAREELPLGRWTEPFRPDPEGNANFNIFHTSESEMKSYDITLFKEYLRLFSEKVKAANAELLVVLIPTREQVYPDKLQEVIDEFDINTSELNMNAPNELLKEITGDLGIDFIDLLPPFQNAEPDMFFERDEHLTKFGHECVATAIGEHLESKQTNTSTRILTRIYGSERYPVSSSDGSEIIFQSFRNGNMELFIADKDFENQRRLTHNSIDESHPSLSNDGSKVIFTSGFAHTHRTEVVLMNLDGSKRRIITNAPNEYGSIPVFSSSNKLIAYAQWEWVQKVDNFTTSRIVVRDTETDKVDLISNPNRESWRPVFSPDEATVVYISRVDENFDLIAHDRDTGEEKQLTKTPYDEWDPQFSPDGKSIVYAARKEGNWDLFLLKLEDNSVTQLTRTDSDEWDPSVSPDGKTIYFASESGLIDAIYSMELPE
ncbi:GDSL-type esterase/lipase family protein [Akkermansiaceae bacterium]|nr:GDSL-type esterase/lipase family protein [Akkermansiaceae bacterium]